MSFKKDSTSPALTPEIHLTMAAGVSNATFLTIELPITRVFPSAGVLLCGKNLLENLLETQVGWR